MKTKEQVLEENGYEVLVGYCFQAPPAEEEDMLTFVDQKEAERVIALGPQKYWWNSSHDRLYDLDYAWDCFYEDYLDKHDLDMSMDEFDKKMGVK